MLARTRLFVTTLTVLTLAAVPGPSHANITPANVASLATKWDVQLPSVVTGGPIFANGLVYAASWDGTLYALDPTTGAQRWTFPTGSTLFGGAVATADGTVCIGTATAHVYCVNGTDGSLRWDKDLARPGLPDAIWSALAERDGRLFVSIAGFADQPCSRGRVVALDLATGNQAWAFATVPDKICKTDTSVACTTNTDCAVGECVDARGGGVTATVTFDPTGSFIYMNTVGCYTFPSIGDSDSIFKLDTATGNPLWKTRVTPAEQFGTCANESSVECGQDAHCTSVGGACNIPKSVYHDFGFVNGPLRIEVPNGGGTQVLIVSGSKDGTLYALRETDGMPAWTNPIVPIPISPGFAAYGLFNGAINYADGRIYAALGSVAPPRVCSNDPKQGCTSNADCPSGGSCPLEPQHLMAFDEKDGHVLWSAEIGRSWSSVAVTNGVVYAGTNAQSDAGDSSIFAHDATTGARLATFTIPATSAARPLVVGDTLIVGYGVFDPLGGVRAFSLCGNGQLDPGEGCDPGTVSDACCSAGCQLAASTAACDDTDACTTGDVCGSGTCAGTVASVEAIVCTLDRVVDQPCADPLPQRFAAALVRRLHAARKLISKAAALAAQGKAAKAEKLRTAATARLTSLATLTDAAVHSHQASRRITSECKRTIDALAGRSQQALSGFVF